MKASINVGFTLYLSPYFSAVSRTIGAIFGSECDRYWGINDVQSDSLVRMIYTTKKGRLIQTAFRKKIKTINNKLIVELS